MRAINRAVALGRDHPGTFGLRRSAGHSVPGDEPVTLTSVISVFLGAGLGGVLRYMIGEWVTSRWSSSFPWHTLAVNVVGSFFIGLLMGASLQRGDASLGARLFLGVGLLGGFTTLSTLSYETVALFQQGQVLNAVVNMFGSVLLGVTAAAIGIMAGRAV